MEANYLSAKEAAESLNISVLTLYDWLGQSDRGSFLVRGQPFTVSYLQGGRRGQGRIQIPAAEIDRLRQAMLVQPVVRHERRLPRHTAYYPGIDLPLGLPSDGPSQTAGRKFQS